ncbi:unnamed protein product [Rotaria magnacalcarata]|uniref:SH3 and PX domain-containing protein 2A n=1 Tax=Rotaria magnacalcarata TaxID=392030 RepID=A0A816YTL7_9BILA|nr:unnamed protein product [Rotaria magnacalcarata]
MNNKKSSNNTAYIKSVKIVNVEKRYQPGGKHYVYVIEVNWSNSENLFTIYRRYNQFFDLQCRILNLLAATGLRSNHRIPYLPGKIILGRSQIHQIATERKTTLDEYCQKLFSLPERITRSRPILEFFRPSKTDEEKPIQLNVDESKLIRKSSIDISNLTKSVTFRCIQDFNADDKNEMSLKQNDIVEVLDNTDNGWWLVNKGNQKGYVPATFLETTELNPATKYIINKTCEADPDESRLTRSSSIDISNLTKLVTFRCIQDFNADDKNEMSLKQNDIVEVLDNTDNGWWLVNKGNQKGYVPATFLVPTELHQDNHQEESFNKSISITKYVVNESYDAIMTDEISLLKDSCVIVIEKSLLGWWRVEFNNNTGLFPSAYLTPWEMLHTSENSTTNTSAVNAKIKELDDSDDSDWDDDDDDYEYSKEPNNDAKFELYYAHSDYSGNTEDFLSFRRGDCIEIRDKTCGGWWYGRRVNSEQILTWIPGNHLQKEPILNETSDDRNDPPSIHSECDSNISDIPLDVSANKQEEKILADIEDQSLESPLLTEVVYAEVIQTPQIVEPEKVHNKSPVSIPAFQKNNNDKDTKPKAVKELVKLYNQLIV